jgi:hypothetical protein
MAGVSDRSETGAAVTKRHSADFLSASGCDDEQNARLFHPYLPAPIGHSKDADWFVSGVGEVNGLLLPASEYV